MYIPCRPLDVGEGFVVSGTLLNKTVCFHKPIRFRDVTFAKFLTCHTKELCTFVGWAVGGRNALVCLRKIIE